jgi:hypothetical protein
LTQIKVGVSRIWQETFIDRYRLWSAHVHGIEVTQAIQYHRANEHLTDTADRGPDNSVQLVAYKAAWVRVYVRSGLFSSLTNVTGTLEVARRNYTLNYDVVATYTPQGVATVTAEQTVNYSTERNSINRTLNFVIPAQEFYGTLRLTARLQGFPGAESSIVINARLIQTLRVRAILVAYNGPSSANPPAPGQPPITQLTLPAPTLANLQSTASMAFAAMPVQATGSFASCGTLNWATPLDDMRTAAGACSTNWDTLLNWLALLRDNDGNRADVVYYGLLPSGIPLNVPGCGEGGLGAGAVGDQLTFLHEIGHGYGFDHTPCGPVGTPDPNYPTYEPYASASIGEFGFDIRNRAVFDPNIARDYMSYCNPRWMSLYQHNRLLQHPRLAPRWVSERSIFDDYPQQKPFDIEHLWWPDPPWLPDEVLDYRMNAVISLVGRVQDSGEIHVQSVARIHAAAQPMGLQTGWMAQLMDERGNTIARAPLVRSQHHGGCGCGCGSGRKDLDPDRPPFTFTAYIPNVAPGAALHIVGPNKEMWTRQASSHPPRFVHAALNVTSPQQMAVTWQVESESEVDVWAQWTADKGVHWHGLAVGLLRGEAVLPLTGLPAGQVEIRLLAHDGFFTTESAVLVIDLPERAPEVAILYPRDGQTLRVGQPIQVSGNATDTAGNPLQAERLTWMLNGEAVGRGREFWLTCPNAGRHELTFEVDWSEGKARSVVIFNTARDQGPVNSAGR